MSSVTGIYVFPPKPEKKKDLATIAAEVERDAAGTDGFLATDIALFTAADLDWAFMITFESDYALDQWLASQSHSQFLQRLAEEDFPADAPMIRIEPGGTPPQGCAVFTHRVKRHQREPFLDLQAQVASVAKTFDGYSSTTVLPSTVDPDIWTTIVRFDSEANLNLWLRSESRAKLLPQVRDLLEEDYSTATARTPFGAVVRLVGGAPVTSPTWKMVMLVVLVLFPTVTILLSFWNKLMTDLQVPPGIGSVGSQLIATSLVTWLWMPWISRIFTWWIDPIDGAKGKRSVIGAAVVVACYALEIGFFALVPALTPWG